MKTVLVLTMLTVALGPAIGRAMNSSPAGEVQAGSARKAPAVFAKYCTKCHGKDGRARTFKAKFNHARDLTDRSWQDKVSDERLFNSIMNGRGKNMPGFGKKLSEPEIDALVALVRGLLK